MRVPTNQQLGDNYQQIQQNKTIGTVIFCIGLIFGIINLSFIIPDLIYAHEGSQCVTTIPQGFSIDLSTWLLVDAYVRISMAAFLLVIGIAGCCSSAQAAASCFVCSIGFISLFSSFSLIWTVVACFLFLQKLNPTGICTGGVQSYMYAVIIIAYIYAFCTVCYQMNSRKNRQDQ